MQIRIFLFSITLLAIFSGSCEKGKINGNLFTRKAGSYRIMFWNTENLYDSVDDSLKDDEEFLPSGIRHWTSERYRRKLVNVYKTIIAAGMDRPPEIIGLCEIENRSVLTDLVEKTPFSFFHYSFAHHESPDRRGIDVALLYDPAYVDITDERAIKVDLSETGGDGTRDILYARVSLLREDTFSLFVNHWPSKYGGAGITEEHRKLAALKLRTSVSEVLLSHPHEKIIIMGDFNDPPESRSISEHLGCLEPGKNLTGDKLYTLPFSLSGDVRGTNKYQGIWSVIDQFIVTGNLLNSVNGIHITNESSKIFSPGFLLEEDHVYGGKKPYRTWIGMKYQEGFSDHLPVILDVFREK